MGDDEYIPIHGKLVLLAKSPDGDSVRFDPESLADLRKLQFGTRIQQSKDGTVQLRLDGIDAPETHYSGKSQPLGAEARTVFLKLLGFDQVHFTASGTVDAAEPKIIPATILAKMVEIHGRPVAYLFVGDHPELKHGRKKVPLPASLLEQSANAAMVQNGLAYPLLYSSTPLTHREVFVALASLARQKKVGVWKKDKTANFLLDNQDSIGPKGQLIFPKLFRRCSDYLSTRSKGDQKTFLEWLTTAVDGGYPQDDELFVGEMPARLSKVIKAEGQRVAFTADLLEIVFIEK